VLARHLLVRNYQPTVLLFADPKCHRTPDFTSEHLFRALLVMHLEAIDYRETTIRIAESETLQNFCRLVKKETIMGFHPKQETFEGNCLFFLRP